MTRVLTLPDSQHQVLSIRAKALVFNDPGSRELLEQAERVAGSDATVLIIGETGTGKELIARHVHKTSGRSGPFVAVNCGAFSENLVEAELFGHEHGAYTGASGSRSGWFEAAQHGTLFLDEIGDLPLSIQVKLLRVLQERQVVRLGSRKPVDVDVRLVAATNVRLDQAVAAGHFRADLYYRLSVATLQLAPLSQRPGDIEALAEHFIAVYSQRLKLQGVQLGSEAREALLGYDWPGNIRELENVIHYALIINRDGCINAGDLQLRGVAAPGSAAAQSRPVLQAALQKAEVQASAQAIEAEPAGDPATQALQELSAAFERLCLLGAAPGQAPLYDRVEEALIARAYALCHRNQVHTAEMLGITRNVLRTQLKRFGLLAAATRPAPRPGAARTDDDAEALEQPGQAQLAA